MSLDYNSHNPLLAGADVQQHLENIILATPVAPFSVTRYKRKLRVTTQGKIHSKLSSTNSVKINGDFLGADGWK